MIMICRRLVSGLSAQIRDGLSLNFHGANRHKTEYIKLITSVTRGQSCSTFGTSSTKLKMNNIQNLASVDETEQHRFIDSLDHVICDLDGVVWIFGKPIEGAPECLQCLRKLGKKVMFASNNSLFPVDYLKKKLEEAGFGKDPHLINPTLAIVHYLKSIDFDKVVYVVGAQCMKDALREAGFKVAENIVGDVELDLYKLGPHLEDDEDIGAVIIDWETNINFIKCQKAITYLRRPEVIFLTGATDSRFPYANGIYLIGPKYYQKSVEDLSGRTPIVLGKPSVKLNNYILQTCEIKDPSRVLFVGDTIAEDMTFATNSGYKKLLVLSGVTKIDDVMNWNYPAECKPNYYIQSLGHLYKILSNMKKRETKSEQVSL